MSFPCGGDRIWSLNLSGFMLNFKSSTSTLYYPPARQGKACWSFDFFFFFLTWNILSQCSNKFEFYMAKTKWSPESSTFSSINIILTYWLCLKSKTQLCFQVMDVSKPYPSEWLHSRKSFNRWQNSYQEKSTSPKD